MAKTVKGGRARAVWFGLVDVVIILIVAGFIASMFLFDSPEGEREEISPEKLVFAVTVQSPYGEELFLQEERDGMVAIRLSGSESFFGSIFRGDDGMFYVWCELSTVQPSKDREGLWLLGETVLMTGESLRVESELADFTITVHSAPVKVFPGSVGTTEPIPETTEEPIVTTEIEEEPLPETDPSDVTEEILGDGETTEVEPV